MAWFASGKLADVGIGSGWVETRRPIVFNVELIPPYEDPAILPLQLIFGMLPHPLSGLDTDKQAIWGPKLLEGSQDSTSDIGFDENNNNKSMCQYGVDIKME